MNKKSVDTLTDWSEYKATLDLTQDEWDEINLEIKVVGEAIKAKEESAGSVA